MKFQRLALVPSAGKKALKLVDLLDRAILSLGTTVTENLLRYVPDNRSSPRVVAEKWLLKN